MKNYSIYSAGRFVETSESFSIINPATSEIIATSYFAGKDEFENSVIKALSLESELKNMPSFLKYEILMEIAYSIKAEKQYLGEILSSESGKPIKLALGEIERALQTFIVAAEESKRIAGEVMQIDWTSVAAGKEGIVKYFPVGLVAGIAPFNFPLNLAVHKIAPAIAAGCPIILKPATSTPLSTLELARIIDKTALPKGAVSILPMNRQTGNLLVTDPRFKLLSFTGSPEVGWKMKTDAGKKKVVLELGGNAGVIVAPSANLQTAVNKCVSGGFSYSGQVCIHTQRIFIHTSIFDAFANAFVEKAQQMKMGHPLDPLTDISAMIDEDNAIRVEEWVNEAINSGAKLLCGGKRNATFFEPTVLTQTKSEMKVCAMEIFGPVVVLEPYDDFNSAIQQINNSRYGLQAGVFTDSLHEMNLAFAELEVGGVMINEVPTFRVDHMPYGGIKDSGLGREGVKYAMLDMMEAKILVKELR
ncbi:MAG: aldehyde dehydrogenase family protein [Bacteroidota bacterium]